MADKAKQGSEIVSQNNPGGKTHFLILDGKPLSEFYELNNSGYLPPSKASDAGVECAVRQLGQRIAKPLDYSSAKIEANIDGNLIALSFGGTRVVAYKNGKSTGIIQSPTSNNSIFDWLQDVNSPDSVKNVGDAMAKLGVFIKDREGKQVVSVMKPLDFISCARNSLFSAPPSTSR